MFQASCATTALCLYFGTGRLLWFGAGSLLQKHIVDFQGLLFIYSASLKVQQELATGKIELI